MPKHWSEIKGYLEPAEAEQLAKLAVGKDCLEIGSFHGRSSVCIAATAKTLLCVDTFQADDSGQTQTGIIITLTEFWANTEGYNNIDWVIAKSKDFFAGVTEFDRFDLVFVDGLHEYEVVKHDIMQSWRCLRPGGILVVHDYSIGCGVPLAVEHCGLLPVDGRVMSLAWKVKR